MVTIIPNTTNKIPKDKKTLADIVGIHFKDKDNPYSKELVGFTILSNNEYTNRLPNVVPDIENTKYFEGIRHKGEKDKIYIIGSNWQAVYSVNSVSKNKHTSAQVTLFDYIEQ